MGTGQSEVEVAEVVDTTVLIVPPDAGDSVQTMKSGILEVADIVAITKADMPGAARMATDIATVCVAVAAGCHRLWRRKAMAQASPAERRDRPAPHVAGRRAAP